MVLVVLGVALAPQLLLLGWSQIDRNVPGRLWGSVRDAAEQTATLEANPGADRDLAISRIAARTHTRIRVVDDTGNVSADVDGAEERDVFDRIEAFFLGDSHPPSMAELDDTMGDLGERAEIVRARPQTDVTCRYLAIFYCQATIRVATSARGSEVVVVQRGTRRAVQTVYALRYQLLRIGLVTVPLAAILAFYMGRRVVKPLDDLRDEALAQSSLATRNVALSAKNADEVGDLANALNELLAALESKRKQNEAFIADLVHELKSPVAAVQASADSVTADLGPERAERIARLLRESTTKVDRLITQFLELARAEAGLPDESRERVDLVALGRGLVTSSKDDPRWQALDFVFETSVKDAFVHGVSHRLEASLRELVDNAASFAKTKVTVAVVALPASVLVTVGDDGPGIDAEHLGRVFDRFFTTRDRARGTGLGLALVKAVAEAHGGTVGVTSEDGAGACFTLELPLDRAS
ncbi:MAG TPA: HAMP domain-containing sensor histidine kinase [Polyangiaceae bacterium]